MEILYMVVCWLVCGIVCMVTCLRFDIGPDPHAELTEYSAFLLTCLLLWPLIAVVMVAIVVIAMTARAFGRFSKGLADLVRREEMT